VKAKGQGWSAKLSRPIRLKEGGLESLSRRASGRRGRITGRFFVEVVNFIQTAFPWES
jgi:hypothetical protein